MRLISLIALCISVSSILPPAVAEVAAPVTAQDAVDTHFRNLYAEARTAVRNTLSPVIVSMNGNAIFLRNGVREEVPLLSPQWQSLKTVDHVALAIFVLLQAHTDVPLADATRQSLEKLRRQIPPTSSEVAAVNLSAPAAARQKQILDQCLAFIEETLNAGSISIDRLNNFAAAMGPLTLANADDAEEMELGTLDAAVARWKSSMSADEWKNLHVIVCDGHMPRDQERIMLYFSKLLHENREGGRIIFMENGDDESKALNLLATHILDARIGTSFFHDPWRMHRDLLSDGAKHYLQKHKLLEPRQRM